MKNKYLLKVINNEYVIFIHNGYSEFSYGISVNPVVLTYDEYNSLMHYLVNANYNDLVKQFEESQDYDFVIPTSIAKIIGFTLLTLSPPSCCVYTSDEQKENIVAEKKKLINILNNCK